MKFNSILAKSILFLLLTFSTVSASAQCAMCKSSVESNLMDGKGSVGKDLNTGILYLMAIPYIILMVGGYFFFKKQIDAKVMAWKKKHFPNKQILGR